MLIGMVAARLAVRPSIATLVLVFFAYSLLGFIMECIVLSIEKKRLVIDRGFCIHLPFCIIYGFGALIGYAVLSPLKDTWLPLFLVGAIGATAFEYLVARMQMRLFGDFWWDYANKPFNYKGILCLESTAGWGIIALFIIKFLHGAVVRTVSQIPAGPATLLAMALVLAYALDFTFSARVARRKARAEEVLPADAEMGGVQIPGEMNK